MYHSITFGEKNTWDDWGLIPTSRPTFSPPALKNRYVDLPGADGSLDLSTIMSFKPLYANRTGSFEFLIHDQETDWVEKYSEIANYLHGQSMRAFPEDDPGYYYEGRFTLNTFASGPFYSKIVIDYNVKPYKIKASPETEDWLWDPFDFEEDIIMSYTAIQVVNGTEIEIPGSVKMSIPTIHSSAEVGVTFEGVLYLLKRGINKVPEIKLVEGVNILTFNGPATITISSHQRGSL